MLAGVMKKISEILLLLSFCVSLNAAEVRQPNYEAAKWNGVGMIWGVLTRFQLKHSPRKDYAVSYRVPEALSIVFALATMYSLDLLSFPPR